MRTVGQVIVDSLVGSGIDRVFCVPGESYLGLLDALYGRSDIQTVTCRQEGGAGFMALADARLTGRPGVVCVSRGPGASNVAIAVHTAQQDGVPLLLLVGQVGRADVRRGSFQEIDYTAMFGSIAKWTAEVVDADRIGEVMLRALRVATAGVPGPVVIAVPEDVLTAATSALPAPRQPTATAAPSPDAVASLRERLAAAERPVILAGHGLDVPGGREALLACAEAWSLPVLVSFRRHDLMPNDHRLFAGAMQLANPAAQMQELHRADLLLALGTRLTDITTQNYTFPALGRPGVPLVHVHQDPAVLGTHFAADLAIACTPSALIAALGRPDRPLPDREGWIGRLGELRVGQAKPGRYDVDDGVAFEEVVRCVARELPEDAIVTVDAGTFGAPVYRFIPFRPPQRLLAPISGAMGFGVPGAVAAALRAPGRPVICFVGDGGFLMTGGELAVALEQRLPLKVILSDNRAYGSIRIHQEREYPGRSIGTELVSPDFALMGRAYGFAVTTLAGADDLPRLEHALRAPGPQFIVVRTSLAAVLPGSGQAGGPRRKKR